MSTTAPTPATSTPAAATSADPAPSDTLPALCFGDPAPPLRGLLMGETPYSFDHQAGRPVVLIVEPPIRGPAFAALLAALAPRLADFAAAGADVLPVVRDGAPAMGPLPYLVDKSDFPTRCGGDPAQPLLLGLDRNQRVVCHLSDPAPDPMVEEALAALRAIPREPPATVTLPAPVLIVPGILPPALCQHLITCHDQLGNFDSGFASRDAAGAAIYKVDHTKKKRRDHLIEESDLLHAFLREALLRRCAPEIKRAFQRTVTHLDRLLVSRYDADGGRFRRHRDNALPSLAFRQFAFSINLNTGEYDGGHLLFPEYNDHHHAPPRGGALIFSASLLHEVVPVTRGSRYVLLGFLHDDDGEALRRRLEAG